MKPVEPIIVVDLFPEILGELLTLLSDLTDEEWCRPTACSSWSVKDVAQHLLGDDISILSRTRLGLGRREESAPDFCAISCAIQAHMCAITSNPLILPSSVAR